MAEHSFAFLRRRRSLILTAVLVVQAVALSAVSRKEDAPVARPLAQFPSQVGSWQLAQEVAIDAETLQTLRADDVVSRHYVGGTGRPAVAFFVAWFRSQRTGQAPHSPKNCLPGSGWAPSESGIVSIAMPGGRESIQVNRYVVSRGDRKSVVLYWYQSRQRVVASEYRAKVYLVADAIRYNRTDTALVRIVAPVTGDDVRGATAATEDFARAAYPALRAHLPS